MAGLRNRQLGGNKFRRQVTIGPFIVDFACIDACLIVEIDGGQHSEERDAARTAFLQSKGYRVIRFWNNEVLENIDGVLQSILMKIEDQAPSPNPLPLAGEGF
jgi:very-short-patch-repair endonuclease